jgi:quinoprotein glucose dehydrogenase
MNIMTKIFSLFCTKKSIYYIKRACGICLVMYLASCQNHPDQARSWSVYKADAASSSYSPLTQINKENVTKLKVAWTFHPGDGVENSWHGPECNPIIIDDVMYATSARHRVYAIEASTGKQIWSFDPFDGGPGGGANRAVTYWQDGQDKRILFTAGNHLFALDAKTGKPIPSFGEQGKVDLNIGMRDDPNSIRIVPTSPGIVYKDLLILGTEVSELYGAQPGYERAYNIRTGKLEWTFHTIPHPGETGYDTWPADAWKYVGGANDWGGMSLDEKRGIVYLATGSPTYDSYGADRHGKNLFGNSIVALDANTGKLIWYYQTIHHDLWDFDLPAPPNLVTITHDGQKIDAVAQVSKVGFVYVLNRETGEPIFPIEERKVPASDVPGEQAWPTQPFPTKPAPFSRQWMTEDDLANYSPGAHDSLVQQFKSFRYEGLFTPPSVGGTISLPSTTGGSEWGGAAVDPTSGVLYVKGNESPEIITLQKIEPEAHKAGQSDYMEGKGLYDVYCASCHGGDRKGIDPYPSLIGLKDRLSKEAVLKQIREGGGKMPSFATILKGHEKAFIDFLFELKGKGGRQSGFIKEIQQNEIAQKKSGNGTTDTGARYLNVTAYRQFVDAQHRPAIKPPWGTLNAIDLNTGEYLWKVPVGNIAELQKPGDPPTGAGSSAGPIVTAGGLVFFGGTRENVLRAYDKDSGKLIWETRLPGRGSATPCTYWSHGKQYLAISVEGSKEDPGGSIIAFALGE